MPQTLPLTRADSRALLGRLVRSALALALAGCVFAGFFAFIGGRFAGGGVPLLVFAGFFAAVYLFIVFANLYPLLADLRSGNKLEVEGRVEGMQREVSGSGGSSVSYGYVVTIAGEPHRFQRADYQRFVLGAWVRVELAPRSRFVLALESGPPPAAAPELEQESPLTDDERLRLRQLLRQRSWQLAKTFLLVFAIACFLAFVVSIVLIARLDRPWLLPAAGLAVCVPLAVCAYFVRRVVRTYAAVNADVAHGFAREHTLVVREKVRSTSPLVGSWVITSTRGDFFYLQLGERRLEVSEEVFEAVSVGGRVRVREAPRSREVLDIQRV